MNDCWKSMCDAAGRSRSWRMSQGIAVVTVNRWERGKQQPAGYYRLKLTTLFEKSAEELGLVEGQAEVVSPVYAKEPQENENEVVSAFRSERNDQVKDT